MEEKNDQKKKDARNPLKEDNQNEVREGQEDSSILHDKDDELPREIKQDESESAQEEFIDDDKNTNKASE